MCKRKSLADRRVSTRQTEVDSIQETNHSDTVDTPTDTDTEGFRRIKLKWPCANESPKYREFEDEVLRKLKKQSSIENGLQHLADMIYYTGLELFGEIPDKKGKVNIMPSRRNREITNVKKEKKSLRTQWLRAPPEEKAGIKVLYEDIKKRLRLVMRVERKKERRRMKQKARKEFLANPYKFAKSLFQESRSGNLECSKEELENHLRNIYSDRERESPLAEMDGIPKPTRPGVQFETGNLRFKEVEQFIRKARSKSAPGQDRVPYKVYKQCPRLLNKLFLLLHRAWKEKVLPKRWTTAEGVYIPKEQDSRTLDQFRPISLLNVDGKVFFGVIAKRTMHFLLANGFVDKSVQKAGIPGVPGCVEHASMIWDQIQFAKSNKTDLSVVWLDLANAFGSVPLKFLRFAMETFWIPQEVIDLMMEYYDSFTMRFSTDTFTTEWQRLEIGIAAGCTISVIWFLLAMEVILRAVTLEGTEIQAPKKAFMDDITLLTQTVNEMESALERFDALIEWAKMKFKAKKSRSVTFSKGKQKEVIFTIGGEAMPTVKQQPVKSLGRMYSGSLNDRHKGVAVHEEADEGLVKIDKTNLPGKFKVWCLQFALYPRLQWPLMLYEIALTRVERIEQRCNVFIRKWFGLPNMITTCALYKNGGPLELPIPSIAELYKCGKVRTTLMLQQSNDEVIRSNPPELKTGRKWRAIEETEKFISILEHGDIVGATQTNTSGLGSTQFKSFKDMTKKERTISVVNQVAKEEKNARFLKLVQCSQQGQCVSWQDKAVDRVIKWSDFWKWDPARISFLIRSVYDMLPSPANLVRWKISENEKCRCGKKGTMRHILSNCPLGLERRYTWRHNRVLRVLHSAIRDKVDSINQGKKPQITYRKKVDFCKEGTFQKPKPKKTKDSPEWEGKWELSVDLGSDFFFPLPTRKKPDMVIWSEDKKTIKLIELTIPWETNFDEAWIRKDERYEELVNQCEDSGWSAKCLPIEIGARGFIGHRVYALLKDLGFSPKELKDLIANLQETVEKASFYIWLKRDDENWTQDT